jgi:predicted AlkP superfamily phosphohydrolase/phosphomutase
LVIVGIDAGDSRLLQEWGGDGTLPVVGNLLRRGCWGVTTGPELISEHGMWVTLTSGVSRAQHGYYYHRQLVPGTYRLAPVRGRDLDVRPFWQRLGNGARVAVMDVPDVAEPRPQPGIQLSDWATHDPHFPVSAYPHDTLNHARRVFGRQIIVDEEPFGTEEEDRSIFERLRRRIEKKGALCDWLLAQGRFDLICIVFGECHTGGHQLWKYMPEPYGSGAASTRVDLTDGLRRLYQGTDAAVGRIIQRAGSEANVFVIASVGLKSQYPAAGLGEAFCRQLGYQGLPGASKASARSPMAWLRRALPHGVRARLSGLVPRAIQERWISDKFESSIDWDRTLAFCIPSYYTSFFRVNLQGREPQGIVKPGADYEAVLDRLEKDLALLVDPVTSKPAVRDLARSTDLFGGGPPQTLPDLFVEWAEADHFMERLEHPRAVLRQAPCEFHRGSDHSRQGLVAAAGPQISGRGNLGELSPLDLVPTFLRLLNASPAPDLPGRPHAGILGASR